MKNLLFVIVLLCASNASLIAQNVFVEREYWAKKPTIEAIKQKMAEGHNLLELKPGGFDGPMWAVMEDCDFETIKFIFDQPGIDFTAATLHHANNYLMWTTYKGNLPVMKLLLAKGSKTDIINSHGQSLLMHAAMSGKADPAIYEFCLQNGGDMLKDKDKDGRNAMLTAIGYLKDVSFLDFFLKKGLNITDTDNKGNGLFHYATVSGNLNVLKGLVAMGVSYAPNKEGDNALSFVGRGRGQKVSAELFQYLTSLGLDPKTTFSTGQTLAHTAARMGFDSSALQFIAESGLNLGQADKDGNTPLMLAAYRGDMASVKYWLAKNEVNAVNNKGQSALLNAVAYNKPEIVKFLLEKGAKANLTDGEGHNLIHNLVSSYRKGKNSLQRAMELMDLLKTSGVDVKKSGLLLHAALDKDDNDLFTKLMEMGQDINAKDSDGYTVLHYASMKAKNIDLVKFLVAKGADSSINTPLDESVSDLIAANEVLGKQNSNLDFLKK
ncbi:MAG: ankyrin repeat domain-containing protein [Saprospiraceae bacterium]|nr:ankyrin repeat domain-containing protein [Saprospiraceae bacterium]